MWRYLLSSSKTQISMLLLMSYIVDLLCTDRDSHGWFVNVRRVF